MDLQPGNLQTSVQSPPRRQTQADPSPEKSSWTSPTMREDTETQCDPPADDINDIDVRARKRQRDDELRTLAKTFGSVPNVPIFTGWDKRQDCSDSAVHRSIMAGICGNSKYGAYSVVLSSLYKDDEDGGDTIIYTGAGGRKRWSNSLPPKRIRVGPQIMNQSWDHPANKALKVSCSTGNPIRVVRSWKCPSQYAPVKGYRYDGLYKVAACWTAKGRNGKDICRSRLERLPGQPAIPEREITLSTSRRRRERLVPSPACSPSPSINRYDISDETDFDIGSNQFNPSPAQLAGSTRGTSLLRSPQQQATPETPAGADFHIGEVDLDVKDVQILRSERVAPPISPSLLPRYRWDPRKKELVKVPTSHPTPPDPIGGVGNEEERRGEDDATLVPCEDGLVDMPANEHMETESFSDAGNSP